MMGFGVSDDQTPTVKGSSGLLALPLTIDDSKSFPCVSCGKCVQHCPMGLQPNRMFRLIKHGKYQEAMNEYSLMDCKECGCCAYTCPSDRNPVAVIRRGKNAIRNGK
jgi:electron transport complex protein RnfC